MELIIQLEKGKDEILGEDFHLRNGTFSLTHTQKKKGHQFAWRSSARKMHMGNPKLQTQTS